MGTVKLSDLIKFTKDPNLTYEQSIRLSYNRFTREIGAYNKFVSHGEYLPISVMDYPFSAMMMYFIFMIHPQLMASWLMLLIRYMETGLMPCVEIFLKHLEQENYQEKPNSNMFKDKSRLIVKYIKEWKASLTSSGKDATLSMFLGFCTTAIAEEYLGLLASIATKVDTMSADKLLYIAAMDDDIEHFYRTWMFFAVNRCACCGKSSKDQPERLICSKCKMISYCSRECQERGWATFHPFECKRRAPTGVPSFKNTLAWLEAGRAFLGNTNGKTMYPKEKVNANDLMDEIRSEYPVHDQIMLVNALIRIEEERPPLFIVE
jgi:hypothetical protein